MAEHPAHSLLQALHTVALIEAAKGALVLLVGFGLLALLHHDIQRFAERLIAHAHLNPAARYPRIFIEAASHLTDVRLVLLAVGAVVYSVVRFIEAYGLWHARRWAEWVAALSGAIYIPFELVELHDRATWLSLGAFILNLAIVAIMLYCVLHADRKTAVR
jgi:uncharacterized membrane protein (DUF2068 family)